MISASVNMFIGGKYIDKDWGANDGIVPLKSALYPFNEDHITYDESREIIPGVWYVMPTIYGADHYDFCNAADKKLSARCKASLISTPISPSLSAISDVILSLYYLFHIM